MAVEKQEIIKLKERVDKLERCVAFMLEHLKIDYKDDPTAGLSPTLRELIQSGKTNDAIKQYMAENGGTLQEAKRFIDSIS